MKNMKKKLLSVLLATGMVATLLAGCGSTASEPSYEGETKVEPNESSEPNEPSYEGEIKVYAWTQMADALSSTAEQFMAAHPEAVITVEQVDSSYTKLYPELASGQGVADVFMVQNTDIQSFMKKYEGQIMDVTDIISGEEDNFVASALATCYDSEKERYFGVPIDIGPCAMYYRADIFEEAGVDVDSIKTWDDYIEAGKTILEATNGTVKMAGFDFNGASSQDYMKLLFAQQGGSYYAEDGSVDLTTEEMIRAAEMLNKMIDADILMDFPNEWNDRITALAAGQICTLTYPAWFTIVFKDSAPDQSGLWKCAPIPSFDGESGNVCLGGSVLAASATSKYPELAKAFIEYSLMNIECVTIMYEQASQFQAYKPFYEAECYRKVDDYFGYAVGETFAQWVDSPEINFGPYFTDVTTGLTNAMGQMFVNNVEPAEALAEATEIVQRAIDNQ